MRVPAESRLDRIRPSFARRRHAARAQQRRVRPERRLLLISGSLAPLGFAIVPSTAGASPAPAAAPLRCLAPELCLDLNGLL